MRRGSGARSSCCATGWRAGEEWAGDPEAIEARLAPCATPAPARSPARRRAGAEVADAIAGRAVTVVRDDRKLLPLRARDSVLVVTIAAPGETVVEDPLRGEPLDVLRAAFGRAVRVPRARRRRRSRARSRRSSTSRARFRPRARAHDARAVPARRGPPRPGAAAAPGCVVVALRNPFDFEIVPAATPATLVTAYGFRPVHQRALLRVLRGEVETYGRLPIELEPGRLHGR